MMKKVVNSINIMSFAVFALVLTFSVSAQATKWKMALGDATVMILTPVLLPVMYSLEAGSVHFGVVMVATPCCDRLSHSATWREPFCRLGYRRLHDRGYLGQSRPVRLTGDIGY